MSSERFQSDLTRIKQTILVVAGFQLIAFLISVIMNGVWGKSTRGAILVLACLSLVALVVLLAILLFGYFKSPPVRTKLHLKKLAAEALAGITQAQNRINQAPRIRQQTDKNEEAALAKRKQKYQEQLSALDSREQSYNQDEKDELSSTLLDLQRRHVSKGLATSTISAASISGIGPKLKQRLASHGIRAASDVSGVEVRNIPGFGEAKVNSLLAWRGFVEQQLEDTMPKRIPYDIESAIHSKYITKRDELNVAREEARISFENDSAAVKREFASRRVELDKEEQLANANLAHFTGKHKDLTGQLLPLQDITFLNFLLESIQITEGRLAAVRGASVVLLPLMLIAGSLYQGSSAVRAVSGIIIDSIPTNTPTPTLTSTITPTPVPSSTPTPTTTQTPTNTLTPTVTQTSTQTQTPTITFTPSITPTPTVSPTPTITLFPNVAACVPRNTERIQARVVRVIDGDTIDVQIAGQTYRVRYIGIDTPETGEFCASQATSKNKELVGGKTVILVKDVSEVDRYDRLLRYVFVGDIFVNWELVNQGYASAATFPPDVSCSTTFISTESTARDNDRGCWKPTPTPGPKLPPPPPPSISQPTSPPSSGNCHPSYPTVCIPPPPPDLNCPDISYRRFKVIPPDPHNFDGDKDGIGCESN